MFRKKASVCRFKTSPCVPAPRAHLLPHAGVVPVHTGTFLIYTRRRFFGRTHGFFTFFQRAAIHTNTHTHTNTTPQHTTPHGDRERDRDRQRRREGEKERRRDREGEKTRKEKKREDDRGETRKAFPSSSFGVVLLSPPSCRWWCRFPVFLLLRTTKQHQITKNELEPSLGLLGLLLLLEVLPSSSSSSWEWCCFCPRSSPCGRCCLPPPPPDWCCFPLALLHLAGAAPSLPSWSRLSLSPSPWSWCRSGASAQEKKVWFRLFSNFISCVWSFSCHLSFSFSCSVLFFIFLLCFLFISIFHFNFSSFHFFWKMRRRVVCGSTFNDGRTRAHVTSTAPASEGWRFVPDTILPGYQGHPSGSQQGHPRYTGARSAGRLWVAHAIGQHSTQCRNTPNKGGSTRDAFTRKVALSLSPLSPTFSPFPSFPTIPHPFSLFHSVFSLFSTFSPSFLPSLTPSPPSSLSPPSPPFLPPLHLMCLQLRFQNARTGFCVLCVLAVGDDICSLAVVVWG